jgi:hypothetical protein
VNWSLRNQVPTRRQGQAPNSFRPLTLTLTPDTSRPTLKCIAAVARAAKAPFVIEPMDVPVGRPSHQRVIPRHA